MGRIKIRFIFFLLVIILTFFYFWKKGMFTFDNGLSKLQPSYIIAVRGNDLPLYGFVKGITQNNEPAIYEANANSKEFLLQLLERPPLKKDNALENCLNMHIWDEICFTNIENLLFYPLYPALPSRRLTLPILDLLEIGIHSGIRIFGYLIPPRTSNYKFYLSLSNTVGQVWLSTNNKIENSRLLINATYFISSHEFESNKVGLEKDSPYFVDITLKTGKNLGTFSLKWLRDDEVSEKPFDIDEKYLRPYFNENDLSHTYLHPSFNFHLPMLKSRKNLSQLYETKESKERFKSFEIDFMSQEDADVIFSTCTYHPSYVGKDYIKSQYQGVWETHLTSVFPNDQSNVTFQLKSSPHKQIIFGNPLLGENEAIQVAKSVFKAIEKKHGFDFYKQPGYRKPVLNVAKNNQLESKYRFDSVINVELNMDPPRGKRYLVELKLLNSDEKFVRYSEYVYLPKGSNDLCYPSDFKWNKTAEVNFILTCGKQGRWVKYFIESMERLYEETKDNNFNVIIVDFNTNDIDVAKVLYESSLPRYTLLKRTGKFHKTIAIQSATNSIRSDDAIAFQVDLHTTIPSNFVEIARKHAVKGKMAWSPMLVRLQCGSNPQHVSGSWEISGYGIFAVFKSDWLKFGGMNIEKFLNKWGGEDWDLLDRALNSGLEVERLKIVNFAHIFHSKKGMWHELI